MNTFNDFHREKRLRWIKARCMPQISFFWFCIFILTLGMIIVFFQAEMAQGYGHDPRCEFGDLSDGVCVSADKPIFGSQEYWNDYCNAGLCK